MQGLQQRLRSMPFLERSLLARQVVKFLLVGVTNTAWDYALYIVLTRGWLGFELHFLAAQFFAFVGAVLNSYFLNKRWTFRHADPRHHIHLSKFFLVNIISLLLNESLLFLLVGHLHMYDLLAKMVVIVPVMAWNFIANKYWTFRQNPNVALSNP